MFPKKPHILCVDGKECCEMLELMLNLRGFDCKFIWADSAEKALELMVNEKFDLYLLEYRLPEMSGIELCWRIRQTDWETPILFFTGMARPVDRAQAMAVGATEYLIKPNDLDRFAETIERLLQKSPIASQPAIKSEVHHGIY